MNKQVYVQITAFDKNSNDNMGRSIVANTKKSFNKQVEEFEMDIPYTKYYITLVSDEPLLPEQELIVSDYEVENKKLFDGFLDPEYGSSKWRFEYKVIIPKEESKQELSLKINDEFLDTTSKEILYTLMEEFDNLVTENSSEETLEEVAEKIADNFEEPNFKAGVIYGFIEGAKWQKQQMYNEEEVHKIVESYQNIMENNPIHTHYNKWFEQFKKK